MFDINELNKKYKVHTQSSLQCRNGLEIIEKILLTYKKGIKYNYCETGSYYGGTLLPRLNSQYCSKCLSIDKRVDCSPDERREKGYSYKVVNTTMMISILKDHLNKKKLEKLECFDGTIQEYLISKSNSFKEKKFDWIFIDAEHTNIASVNDFLSSMPLISKNGVIAMHDSWMIFSAISNLSSFLDYLKIKYRFAHIDGAVSAFFFGEIAEVSKKFDKYFITTDQNLFVKNSRDQLWNYQTNEILKEPINILLSCKLVVQRYLNRVIYVIFRIPFKLNEIIQKLLN